MVKKRIAALAAAFLLLCMLPVAALATHPVPDLSRKGSITFHMKMGDTPLETGRLNLYKVGDIANRDGDFIFVLDQQLKDSGLTLENVNDPILAQELLTIAKVMKLEKLSAPIEAGKVLFSDLEPGLYVVWQDGDDVTKGFAAISPFVISVPKFQDGEYVMDVTADPKVPLETMPTTPPTEPPQEEAPQTGQLNWPIPVLSISGAALMILGFVLRIAGKKEYPDA